MTFDKPRSITERIFGAVLPLASFCVPTIVLWYIYEFVNHSTALRLHEVVTAAFWVLLIGGSCAWIVLVNMWKPERLPTARLWLFALGALVLTFGGIALFHGVFLLQWSVIGQLAVTCSVYLVTRIKPVRESGARKAV